LRFDIASVAEKTSARTMKREEKIIVNDWWKRLKEQRLWSRSSERWWKKRFENLEKERLENASESLDDDFENDLENANSMNTKLVNLHVIFSFSI
jgi:hypothetical protein